MAGASYGYASDWLLLITIAAVPLAVLAVVLQRRLARSAVAGLVVELGGLPQRVDLCGAISRALGDPTLELAFRLSGDPERWVDAGGRTVTLPEPGERCVTVIRDGGRAVAAVIHDPALMESRQLVRAAASAALVALDNQRLAAELRDSLRELRASRARIVAAADDERRRIERDLHDGAQQELVSLRVRLKLAEERLADNDPAGLLHELGDEIDAALDEIRSLARGIYPALLADRGLAEALRAAALRAPVLVELNAHPTGRFSHEIENAIYFSCLEALQNACKHGRASTVWVSVADDGKARFEVRDDGAGFDPSAVEPGSGLTNIRDRIAAVGGRVIVESAPGKGTRIAGVIPLRRAGDRFRANEDPAVGNRRAPATRL
jgi:signal transduction histidine kinase